MAATTIQNAAATTKRATFLRLRTVRRSAPFRSPRRRQISVPAEVASTVLSSPQLTRAALSVSRPAVTDTTTSTRL